MQPPGGGASASNVLPDSFLTSICTKQCPEVSQRRENALDEGARFLQARCKYCPDHPSLSVNGRVLGFCEKTVVAPSRLLGCALSIRPGVRCLKHRFVSVLDAIVGRQDLRGMIVVIPEVNIRGLSAPHASNDARLRSGS